MSLRVPYAMYFVVCSEEGSFMGTALEADTDMQCQLLDISLVNLDILLQQAEQLATGGNPGGSGSGSGSGGPRSAAGATDPAAELWQRVCHALAILARLQLERLFAERAGQRGAAMRVLGSAARVLRLMLGARAEMSDELCAEGSVRAMTLIHNVLARMLEGRDNAALGGEEEAWDLVLQVVPHIAEAVRLHISGSDSFKADADRKTGVVCCFQAILAKTEAHTRIFSAGRAVRWCYAGAF